MADTKYAVKSGFYDSVNRDRLYSADDMNQPYKEILTEGIDAGGFEVTPQSTPNMTVNVAAGHAFLGGKWVDAVARTLTVPENTAMYGRYDAVVLQVDTNSDVREASIVYRTGTPAAIAEIPALINTGGISEVMLAYITVAAGATSISTSYIHDTRGGSDCPYADIKLGQLVREQQIAEDVSSWLTEHVNPVGSAVVVDDSLSIAGAAADAKATGDALTDLNNDLSAVYDDINTDELLFGKGQVPVPATFINYNVDSSGKPSSPSSTRLVSNRIQFPKGCAIKVTKIADNSKGNIFYFDKTDTKIGESDINITKNNTIAYGYTMNAEYIRLFVYHADTTDISPSDASNMYTFDFAYVPEYKNEFAIEKTSANLIDISKSIIGKYINNAGGDLDNSSSYNTTDFIPVNGHSKIIFRKRFRKLLGYNKYKGPIGATYDTNGQNAGYVYTVPDNVAYVKISYFASDTEIQANYGDTLLPYTAYQDKVEEGIHLSDTMKSDIPDKSVLTGKKWVACGDSFTYGDFNGLDPADYQYQSGIYTGKNKVYPYVIGLRAGMTIVNEAVNGSTMAYVDGQRAEFSTPNGRYTQIPSDADYITLYFGINDSHHSVPIGTISDNTNTTFYGAWNIVMQYLIANHPDAKIGIIISNGCDTVDYPNAEKAIAKKYGVSCLDINSDYNVPILFRVNGKPDTDASIITANYQHYRVSSTNGHPNVKMHEYESTIIQKWLESI